MPVFAKRATVALLLFGCALARADLLELPDADPLGTPPRPEALHYSTWENVRQDYGLVTPEYWLQFSAITVIGIKNWDWGSSRFHVHHEGWFGMNTGSGGNDKLGHAFTSYGLTNSLAEEMIYHGVEPRRAATSAALLSLSLMTYIEMFDGFSIDHGFSQEDMVMNISGMGLAWLRQVYPAFRDLVDYRMEYWPSGYKHFNPVSDYAGQKYLFAFKFAGLPSLRHSPARFLELQAGYYTRGFSTPEAEAGIHRTTHAFAGVGLNLGELLLGHRRPIEDEAYWTRQGHYFFDHFEIPYTAARHAETQEVAPPRH